MSPVWLNNGFPPEVRENWIPITAWFVVPTIVGILMEGTLRPGVLFFGELFAGLIASCIASMVTVWRAQMGQR